MGGAAVVAAYFPQWGIFGPWVAASLYIVLLGLVMWMRFLGGKWRTMAVVEVPPVSIEETAGAPPA